MALRKLRWRCRRGMKEMDAMLGRYLERHADTIPLDDMERLLECQDDQLWQWLMGRSSPEDGELKRLIVAIRESQHR